MTYSNSSQLSVETIVESYADDFALSPQERRLLACAVHGLSDKQAALELGCSRNTVGTYWQRIYRKVGVRPQRDVLAHLLRVSLHELADQAPESQVFNAPLDRAV